MQEQEYASIYVYGIVDGKIGSALDVDGVGNNEKVYCIPFKDVTAVVSNTPFMEYDPTEDNTVAHEKVIQEVLKDNLTIAPMRFCTILRTKNDLIKLLQSAYMPFKRNILKIRNKLEFDVKVFLDVEKLKAEVNDDSELIEKSREIATTLNDKLKAIAEDVALEEQITDDMIMSASFLVHREKIKFFYEEIKDFDRHLTDKLKIRISGPTAPYNFVDMPTR